MAFEELLAWSNHGSRHNWQRDALRRLAVTGDLTNHDLTVLRRVIERDVGIVDNIPEVIAPLATEHLTSATTEGPRTILGSIGPVRGIDRLASDQPPVKFPKEGLGIVYGANGSGKSGYCRIFKQLCGSPGPRNLKGNVYEAASTAPKEVEVMFCVDDASLQKTQVTWQEGSKPPEQLSRMTVFDSDRARVYVDKNRKIEFLPYELDLLNKLVLAARALGSSFDVRESELERAIRAPLSGAYRQGTVVADAVARVSSGLSADLLPSEEELTALAYWDENKEAELQRLGAEIGEDPAILHRRYKATKQALENLETALSSAIDLLDVDGMDALVAAHDEMRIRATASDAAARGLGAGQPIAEIGSFAWQRMLSYAREFAAETFPDHDDPKLITSDTCVLCQQRLSPDASDRLSKFDSYVSGRAASDSAVATAAYKARVGRIAALQIQSASQVEEALAVFAGMDKQCNALAGQITRTFVALAVRLDAIKAMTDSGIFNEITRFETLDPELSEKIAASVESLRERISALEAGQINTDHANSLMLARSQLIDAKLLHDNLPAVVTRLRQLVERLKVGEARRQCASAGIGKQLTTRRRKLLTEDLGQRLKDELKSLKLYHHNIDLSDKSAKGDSIVEIGLTAEQNVRNNSEVLSEGEQRVLALSCFLAELKEDDTRHGIVVDDPVSSLDHARMDAVAKRLVAEAATGRQVIIFTHNIVFHNMIETEARIARQPCHTEWMASIGREKFGVIDPSNKPPHNKKTPARIDEIKVAIADLSKINYDPERSDEFRTPVTAIYTRMRESWERVVEEIIFNGAIERFSPEIKTQSLKAASFDPETDYDEIYEGMKRCSHFSGHDRADHLPDGLPDLTAIRADLSDFESFVARVKKRKKALEKGPKYEDGVAPVFL